VSKWLFKVLKGRLKFKNINKRVIARRALGIVAETIIHTATYLVEVIDWTKF